MAVFNLLHLLAHTNYLLNCGMLKSVFFTDLTENRCNFDSFTQDTAMAVWAVVSFVR